MHSWQSFLQSGNTLWNLELTGNTASYKNNNKENTKWYSNSTTWQTHQEIVCPIRRVLFSDHIRAMILIWCHFALFIVCFNFLIFIVSLLKVGEKMLSRYPIKKDSDGLETASIGLLYPLSPRNGLRLASAKSDKLQLKCTAKIGSIYWESVVVETILRRDGYMLESRSSGASGNSWIYSITKICIRGRRIIWQSGVSLGFFLRKIFIFSKLTYDFAKISFGLMKICSKVDQFWHHIILWFWNFETNPMKIGSVDKSGSSAGPDLIHFVDKMASVRIIQ